MNPTELARATPDATKAAPLFWAAPLLRPWHLRIRRAPSAPYLAFAVGCAQMIWIVVELLILGEFSFLHPTFFGVGIVVAGASVIWGWPTVRGWRAAR